MRRSLFSPLHRSFSKTGQISLIFHWKTGQTFWLYAGDIEIMLFRKASIEERGSVGFKFAVVYQQGVRPTQINQKAY